MLYRTGGFIADRRLISLIPWLLLLPAFVNLMYPCMSARVYIVIFSIMDLYSEKMLGCFFKLQK